MCNFRYETGGGFYFRDNNCAMIFTSLPIFISFWSSCNYHLFIGYLCVACMSCRMSMQSEILVPSFSVFPRENLVKSQSGVIPLERVITIYDLIISYLTLLQFYTWAESCFMYVCVTAKMRQLVVV